MSGIDAEIIAQTTVDVMDGAVFVTTMSSVAMLDAVPGERMVFPAVAMMGAASGIGLGIALARPDLEVVVLDGDGSLLMELGSLVTVAEAAPRNLMHLVLNNGMWFHETADIPIPGATQVDFCALAKGAGYSEALQVADSQGLSDTLHRARKTMVEEGPVLLDVSMATAGGRSWSDDNPQPTLPDHYFDRVPSQAHELAQQLAALRDGKR